jgi:hypothetical protein
MIFVFRVGLEKCRHGSLRTTLNGLMLRKPGVCTENLSSGVVVVKSAKDGV